MFYPVTSKITGEGRDPLVGRDGESDPGNAARRRSDRAAEKTCRRGPRFLRDNRKGRVWSIAARHNAVARNHDTKVRQI
jgi:hypothetical protein